MIKSKLGIGPMSTEIIKAVFEYSEENKSQIMLIASKNQIDYSGGYVNNWNTKEYMNFVGKLKIEYPKSDVLICRDHCGPGFNGNYDLNDTYSTIKEDIENGFDLIHIDFSKYPGSKEKILNESKKAIEYALKLNPKIKFEIGTDENTGTEYNLEKISEIEKEIIFFKKFCNPEFYVVQTGSLIKEINQVGNFNKPFVTEVSKVLKKYNLKLKEHNADYLTKEEIEKRTGIVDSMNIAPQFGVIQTLNSITKCLEYGVNYEEFLNKAYEGKKWGKWMHKNNLENKFLCGIISGHYHFTSPEYKKLFNDLNEYEDMESLIIERIKGVLKNYENY